MMRPSPWLEAQLGHERAARHACNRIVIGRIITRAAFGAVAGASVVIALQFFGVLPA